MDTATAKQVKDTPVTNMFDQTYYDREGLSVISHGRYPSMPSNILVDVALYHLLLLRNFFQIELHLS